MGVTPEMIIKKRNKKDLNLNDEQEKLHLKQVSFLKLINSLLSSSTSDSEALKTKVEDNSSFL